MPKLDFINARRANLTDAPKTEADERKVARDAQKKPSKKRPKARADKR